MFTAKKINKKNVSLIIFIIVSTFFSFSNAFANDNNDLPNLHYEILNDFEIKITGIKNIKTVYFNFIPEGGNFSKAPESSDLIQDVKENISIFIDDEKFNLKFNKYDSSLYSFYLADEKGKKIPLSENFVDCDNIKIVSNRGVKFSKIAVSTSFFFGEEVIERKKAPYDCYIFLSDLSLSSKTRQELEKEDLINKLVLSKYNFKNIDEYKLWAKRCNSENLYVALNGGEYADYIPFKSGDIIYVKENLLTVEQEKLLNEDDPENQKDYAFQYLVTADPNQLSKCCKILSSTKLEYKDDYEALIAKPILLKFEGTDSYEGDYDIVTCDLFSVIQPDCDEFNNYFSFVKEIEQIIKNPYDFKEQTENIIEKE